jgi:hypothetical protein
MSEFGDYARMYGSVDYSDAVVLDIGADYGTTAEWFLGRGARHVFVSERTEEWVEKLRALALKDARVTVIAPLSEENAADTLRLTDPDIAKIDCEKCERFLLSVPADLLRRPRAWLMETHTGPLYEAFGALFGSLGYTVRTVCDWPPTEKRHIKVISAVRHE